MTTVSVPLLCELNASIVAGLKAAPSEPPASGRLVMMWPSSALRITIIGCGSCRCGSGCPFAPFRAGCNPPDAPHAAKRM